MSLYERLGREVVIRTAVDSDVRVVADPALAPLATGYEVAVGTAPVG